MCGIFCIASNGKVKNEIVNALSFLEYRGYDSSGIGFINENQKLHVIKALGKVSNLISEVKKHDADGTVGIGHTRWATHGKISIENTHPISNENIAVVHNGIIENNLEIKNLLLQKKFVFNGQTDTEVITNLIQSYLDENITFFEAFKLAIKELKGNYSIAIISQSDHNTIYCAKNGSPISIGISKNGNYISSDINILSMYCENVITLNDNEIATITKSEYKVYNSVGIQISPELKKIKKVNLERTLSGFDHYMLKEINEQPKVLKNIFDSISDFAILDEINWKEISKLVIVACGTSYNAAMVAKYWFEKYAKISVEIEFASEFRSRDIIFDNNALYLFISQSGETLDTLSALKKTKKHNVKTLALVNVLESSIAQFADYVIPLEAGIEISVAATKSFLAQLAKLIQVLLFAAMKKDILSFDKRLDILNTLKQEILCFDKVIQIDERIHAISEEIIKSEKIILLGRNYMHPIALEGGLKLKELSYLNVFASAAGELKHGPIALIDEHSVVLAIAPKNDLFYKMLSNIEEVKARGAKIIMFTDASESDLKQLDVEHIFSLPNVEELLKPLLYTIPLQLISYQVALNLGKNVDKPRNLAKSVTVE
ncbi:MAG: glucosamine--fructose-6-phosphate aminotransferase (isomerizing) [Candidatus Midichloriaceae bacterium]|jgi:glucosamine--fructose-6-phosphate aminotransferase (isomerizing)